MKIVIVDDNGSLRKVLAALCVKFGHEVVAELADGAHAAEAIIRARPDVVCLDYLLPGANGIAILTALQAAAPEISVLFMTASDDPSVAGRAADAGAAGFIKKPFSQKQIVEELREVETARSTAMGARAVTKAPGGKTLIRTAVVADDSGSIRLLLKGMLEACGIKVLQTVGSGSEAVVAVRNHQPSLLCLDVEMPGQSGVEALPQILEASPGTIVVMVTGNPSRSLVEQVAALGARGYILKPLRPAYVESYIKKLLGLAPV